MATDSPFTPTQHPFTGSNYPDKKAVLSAYRRMVATHIETAEARESLQQALKDFHSSLAVEDLMDSLKKVLNSPRRRPVYLAVRALVPSRLRDEYDSLIPHIPSNEHKEVQLFQKDDQSLGFSVRGGLEYGCGVFVSEVLPSSKAAQAGLKVGFEITRVNGFTLSDSTHDEVINLMKMRRKLLLSCKVVGMLPEQKGETREIVWKAVGIDRKVSRSRLASDGPILKSTKRIQITQEGESLGISIKTGPNSQSGVVIVEVIPNSSADNAGLKPGDEVIEVNGESLVNISHQEAIELFKISGSSLMLTVKVKDNRKRSAAHGQGGGHYDPLAHPPDNFELLPQDFDIDAEITPDIQLDYHSAFTLKPREGEQPQTGKAKQSTAGGKVANRLSMLDMEALPSKGAPTIASPAALGYGPTLALPTLMQMANAKPNTDNNDESKDADTSAQDQDMSLLNVSGRILDASITARHSVDFTTIGDVPTSLAHLFDQQKGSGGDTQDMDKFNLNMDELQSKQEEMLKKAQQREQEETATTKTSSIIPEEDDDASKKLAEDYQNYQFPVEDDSDGKQDSTDVPVTVGVDKKPANSRSALKKVSVSSNMEEPKEKSNKKAGFKDSVEIIDDSTETNLDDSIVSYPSVDHLVMDIHPSNMEFSDEVLKGRKVVFHTVPKDAPLKIAIRGGSNTALGGSIFISAIREGGAVARYDKLTVGDQILVVDGISLIDVTHEEAVAALQRAMDMESTSIDLVIAELPKKEAHDYAHHSRRSHTGHTLKTSDVNKAHQFLPKFPS